MSLLATNPFSSLSHSAKRWRARSLKSVSASLFLLEAMMIIAMSSPPAKRRNVNKYDYFLCAESDAALANDGCSDTAAVT